MDTTDRAFTGGPEGIGHENWFGGALSLFRRRYQRDAAGADVAVLGVLFDQAVTNRPGARFGPRAIRAASAMLSWPGGPWRWSNDPFAAISVVDTGDVAYSPGEPHSLACAVEARVGAITDAGAVPLCLGGDHYVTGPILKAIAAKHGPLALVQFDSHSDTWREDRERLDHGTMFFHAAQNGIIETARSVQVGIRSGNAETHGFTIIDADSVMDAPPPDVAAAIVRAVGDGPAYLTFDIDFLDPAYAPGTGTPVCGGPSTAVAERILTGLGAISFVGFDVVEVSPPYDHGEVTALAGATMALNMIGLAASRRVAGFGPR